MSERNFGDVKRVGDVFPGQMECDTFGKIEEILDAEVEILQVGIREGDKGEYLTIVVKTPAKGKTFGFNCGGKVVMKKLLSLQEKGLFPLAGKFFKPEGKSYFDVA